MRAFLKAAPGAGAGYGILEIYGIGDTQVLSVILKRISDGKTLTSAGWRDGIHDVLPDRQEIASDACRLWFGPQVIDNLDFNENYELEVPGVGLAPIQKAAINHSHIITQNGAEAWPPPPQTPQPSGDSESHKIYEGVEGTPYNNSPADVNNLPSGVAAVPDAEPDNKKPRGCLMLGCVIFAIWATGAWLLWHWSINTPMPQDNNEEKAPFFELMPRAEGS